MTLRAEGVVVRHGGRTVLAGVDLTIAPGELVVLGGRNGAGKSTLLRVLIGAQPCDEGRVWLRDRALQQWEARARGREMAFVPQMSDCPFEFTGRELVALGRHPHVQHALRSEDLQAIESALADVNALPFADRAVTTLSGGELRRIILARALATAAPLLMLDEPTINLDLQHALDLAAMLRRLADAGRGLLVSTHDLNLLAPVAHRVMLLHDGRIHAAGAPQDVLSAAHFATVFDVAAKDATGYFPRAFQRRDA